MKRFKMNIALVAMLLGITAALAFKPATFVAQKYARVSTTIDPTGWQNVNSLSLDNTEHPAPDTYRCEESPEICTGLFNSAPSSPNDSPISGSIVRGDFNENE